jgi:hypothetical protein
LTRNATGPDEDVVRELRRLLVVTAAEVDGLLVGLRDEVAGSNLDVGLLESLAEGALDRRVVPGEDLVESLDEHDVDRGTVDVAILGDLARGLDSGQPSPADDDRRRIAPSGLGGCVADVFVDRLRVGEALELVCVRPEPVDPEEGRRRAHREEEVVVRNRLSVCGLDGALVGVDVHDPPLDERRPVGHDLVDRDRELRFDRRIAYHAVDLV